jgi:hypothetical protein
MISRISPYRFSLQGRRGYEGTIPHGGRETHVTNDPSCLLAGPLLLKSLSPKVIPLANLDEPDDKENYQRVDDLVRWRSSEDLPPASRYISSPYDQQAHYGKKRSTQWVGYKVHLTETCEAHQPLLVTHVETTSAPITDDAMTATIHAELDRKKLVPAEHIVDAG